MPGPRASSGKGVRKERRKGTNRSRCEAIPPRRSFKKLLLLLSVLPVLMKLGSILKKSTFRQKKTWSLLHSFLILVDTRLTYPTGTEPVALVSFLWMWGKGASFEDIGRECFLRYIVGRIRQPLQARAWASPLRTAPRERSLSPPPRADYFHSRCCGLGRGKLAHSVLLFPSLSVWKKECPGQQCVTQVSLRANNRNSTGLVGTKEQLIRIGQSSSQKKRKVTSHTGKG